MIVAKESGRPTKRTDVRARIILEQLRKIPIEKYACGIAKLSHDTLKRWKDEDPDFALEIESAKAIGQKPWIEKLSDKDPHKGLLASDYGTWKQRTENQQEIKVLVLKKELLGEFSEQELIELTQEEIKKIDVHNQDS